MLAAIHLYADELFTFSDLRFEFVASGLVVVADGFDGA